MQQIISDEIRHAGAISFTRFMELALYCPEYGFYEAEGDKIGRAGAFYTSVSVGPMFGELLAFQFAEWLGSGSGVKIVEAGAHHGGLAKDILHWLRARRPEAFSSIQYCIVEPSHRQRALQTKMLGDFADVVCWYPDLNAMRAECGAIRGVIFSNELLDAMPVHRVGWDAGRKKWFEWGVTLRNEVFEWTRLEFHGACPEWPRAVLDILPDGFTTETCPAAVGWWRNAAELLEAGKLLTLDYGLTAEEFISPERSRGTLRTYSRHQVGDDLLADPGMQDITAQVNFTAVQGAGEAAGLRTEKFVSQEKFLTDIAARALKPEAGFGEWTPARVRQFQTLTHPQHLGRPFRVLMQGR